MVIGDLHHSRMKPSTTRYKENCDQILTAKYQNVIQNKHT